MRLPLFLLPSIVLAAAPVLPAQEPGTEVLLQQLKDIGILPEQKQALRPEDKLDSKRPNPFAERSKVKAGPAVQSVETEEIKIRRIFDGLTISGITKSNGKYSALLGDMILEEGRMIPPVIQEQTQILRVTRVSSDMVEISWVEASGLPRKIVKRVELKPRVGVMLAAQPAGTGSGGSDSGAMAYLDENGKVIWPRKMAPNLQGVMNHLPASGTASVLSKEEEAMLMQPGDGGENAADAASGFSQEPADSPGPGPSPSPPSGPLEDPVQPPSDEDAAAGWPAPSPSDSGN